MNKQMTNCAGCVLTADAAVCCAAAAAAAPVVSAVPGCDVVVPRPSVLPH